MRYLKMALVSFVVFFSMFTVIGLLFPSHINSANAVIINNKKNIVLKEMQLSGSWIKWYPFFQPGIGAHIDGIEKDTTIFFNDKMETLVYNKRVDSNAVSFFMKYGSGRATEHNIIALDIQEDSSQVQLVWKETEKLKWYPWERFRGLVLEKAKKEYLEAVLNRFKQYVDTIKTN